MASDQQIAHSAAGVLGIANIGMANIYSRMIQEQRLHPTVAYRFLRGHKCQTESALFDEFAAGLQFPYYFGENWDALNECCGDLGDIHRQSHALVIGNAHLLLKNATDQSLQIFIEVMNHISKNVKSKPHGFYFSVLLQAYSSSFDELQERLTALGAPFFVQTPDWP